ncbi:hypothetical protein PHLCEN_2v10258 [Hermanssonia centrifuga]|uniref:Uncharacterized protein n=1 Tax=Hermanssonia centrifuga TaxID=98765 RepID=A0A2R6NND4_9APHY|nr:hypothetical protein PHLCEN_2v10258 [Hermanssonia centrifuga]
MDDDEEEDIPTTYTDPVPGSEALEDPASVDPAITSTEGLNPAPESTPTQA